MDLIAATFQALFQKTAAQFTQAGSMLSLTSLGCALFVAVTVLLVRHFRRRGRILGFRAMRRALFPARILLHKSTFADLGFLLFGLFAYSAVFGLAGVSYQFLTNAVRDGLNLVTGPLSPSALPDGAQRAIVTVVLFLAYEFGYWFDHYLKHRIPVLWEMHKVHHSAEVLTPLTNFRMHPLDNMIFLQILAVTAALANGVTAYLFGDATYQYALTGTNVLLVAFIHIYIHLQHTHLWIAFRGLAGRVFVSPAHHQIHHSTDPAHFNKNLGSCLAVWDWMFGTLHVPAREREKLTFGVEPASPHVHTITGEFLLPFGHVLSKLTGLKPRDETGDSAPEEQGLAAR